MKCDQYWPSRDQEKYGFVQVTLLDTTELATYTVRTFALVNLKVSSSKLYSTLLSCLPQSNKELMFLCFGVNQCSFVHKELCNKQIA